MTAPAENRSRGLLYVLGATVVAGAAGYLIQLLAPALLTDATAYLSFSVFWSALYLFVAAIGGVQQEVTRATRRVDRPPGGTTLRTFAFLAAGILCVVTVIVGLVLAPRAFPADPLGMTVWFGVGILGYLFTAVLAGVLYGLSLWGWIAALTVIDALVRAGLVTAGLVLGAPPAVLAAFVAVPFVLAFGLVWLAARTGVVGRFGLDVPARRLALNALGTVVAAAATGVMVTGLPLLLRTTIPDAPAVVLASLVVVITITRAPLIVPLMALQSYLIVAFRDAGAKLWPRLLRYFALVAAATALAAAAAFLWGPSLLRVITGDRYRTDPTTFAVVVISAGLVALLCLSGPALLSAGRHAPYVGGWVAAAAATVVVLLVPSEPVLRTQIALAGPPLVGLAVHLTALRPRSGVPETAPGTVPSGPLG